MQSLNYEITTLDNGIRVITETVNHVQFFSMGIWVGVGSRYEAESQWGITHFIEHMMFKGTEKRTAEEISKAIDEVGGQLNAFTSKENTCYYVKTLTEHFHWQWMCCLTCSSTVNLTMRKLPKSEKLSSRRSKCMKIHPMKMCRTC